MSDSLTLSTALRVNPDQVARLRAYFRQPRRADAATLCSAGGLEYETGFAALLLLGKWGVADLYFLVFHTCVDHAVDDRPYAEGFQPVPYVCKECERQVTEPEDLRYAIQARTRGPLRIE